MLNVAQAEIISERMQSVFPGVKPTKKEAIYPVVEFVKYNVPTLNTAQITVVNSLKHVANELLIKRSGTGLVIIFY